MKKIDLRLVILLAAAALLAPAMRSAAADSCPMGGCCAGGKMVASADDAKAAPAKEKDANADDYPLDTCPVTGAKLGAMGKPVIYNYKGREIRFCCNGCPKKFEKDAATYLKKMDEAIIKKEKASYPLTTCVVTGDKLGGSMGEPIDYVYNNHLVRFCCKGCIKPFTKDPAPYLKKIADARKKAGEKKGAAASDAKPAMEHMDHM